MIFLFLIFLSACEQEDKVADPQTGGELERHFQFLADAGFEREAIVFDKANDRFMIHDDMLISRSDVEAYLDRLDEGRPASGGRTEQRMHSLLLNDANATNFRYYIQPSVTAAWRDAAIQALAQWNSTGSKLHLVQVSSASQANISVFMGAYDEANWVARATLPVPSGTGTVEINPRFNNMAAGQKLFTMVHEMGHNLGLWHTDQTTGTLVPGTPQTDPNSVMNSFVLPWNGFTNYDIIAIRYMYPASGAFSLTVQGESYSTMAGVQLEACSEGGQNVGWIDTGDWMAYNSITFPSSGSYRVEYRVASLNGGGRLSLDLNAGSIVLGTRDVPGTGGWQTWTTVSHNVNITAGTYNVGIYAQNGGWNINWWRITKL